jgi:hypothetical protein
MRPANHVPVASHSHHPQQNAGFKEHS